MEEKEEVLVFPSYILEFDKCGVFQGFSTEYQRYIDGIFDHTTHFVDRESAEENPQYKQIIPYVLFTSQGRIFSYVRSKKSGEGRLKKKRSVGIGGHVNRNDDDGNADYFSVMRAIDRERHEEVAIWCGEYHFSTIGVINDDSNDVGKVHFGIVYRCDLSEPAAKAVDEAIESTEFITLEEALEPSRFAEYEPWSRFVLEAARDGKIDLGESH